MTDENTTDGTEHEDTFRCGSCGYTEPCRIDEVVGQEVERTFGNGRRETERTIVVCPKCESADWHSDSVSESLLGHTETDQ